MSGRAKRILGVAVGALVVSFVTFWCLVTCCSYRLCSKDRLAYLVRQINAAADDAEERSRIEALLRWLDRRNCSLGLVDVVDANGQPIGIPGYDAASTEVTVRLRIYYPPPLVVIGGYRDGEVIRISCRSHHNILYLIDRE